jgi:hypothetical protein
MSATTQLKSILEFAQTLRSSDCHQHPHSHTANNFMQIDLYLCGKGQSSNSSCLTNQTSSNNSNFSQISTSRGHDNHNNVHDHWQIEYKNVCVYCFLGKCFDHISILGTLYKTIQCESCHALDQAYVKFRRIDEINDDNRNDLKIKSAIFNTDHADVMFVIKQMYDQFQILIQKFTPEILDLIMGYFHDHNTNGHDQDHRQDYRQRIYYCCTQDWTCFNQTRFQLWTECCKLLFHMPALTMSKSSLQRLRKNPLFEIESVEYERANV